MGTTTIEARQTNDGTTTLVLGGEVDLSCIEALWETATDALSGHPAHLVIDTSAVTFLNSSVLGTLIRIQEAAREQGTTVVLRKPTPIVQRLLRLSGLDAVLLVED